MVKFNWKKKAAKALVFAMVMGTVGVHGVSLKSPVAVMAGDTTVPTVQIDYTNYTAEITAATGDRYIFVEVLKTNDPKGKASASYCYPVGNVDSALEEGKKVSIIVDLSFLKATKDQYIRVYGDKNGLGKDCVNAVTKTVKAQPSKLTIKYDAVKAILTDKAGSAIKVEDGYTWKSLYGSGWVKLTADSLKGMSTAGATILIRKDAIAETATKEGEPASPEAKVKIAAIPKAPKVKIDYVKGTVTIPKDTQVFLLAADATTPVDFATATPVLNSTAISYSLKELATKFGGDLKNGYTLIVRSKQTDKKAASAPTFITIDPSITITDNSTEKQVTTGTGDDTKVVLTYESVAKGMKLTAKEAAIQYSVDDGKKWATIAAGASKEVKAKNSERIQVRIAGTKATAENPATFPSATAEITCETAAAKINLEAAGETTVESGEADKTVLIKVTILDANGTDITKNYFTTADGKSTVSEDVKCNSSNTGLVTVKTSSDGNGITLTATVKSGATTDGTATVDVSIGNVKNKIDITVKKAPID